MSLVFDPIILGKLLLAAILGGVIGLEREIHGRPAGFRTHLLVSLGACLYVITSVEFYRLYAFFASSASPGVDPGRVAAQVVTGIGFLGAGAIIQEKSSVRGLTTAACLWVAAAIGVACGVGLFGISLVVTVMSLISLLLLKRVESMLTRDTYVYLRVWSEVRPEQLEKVETLLEECNISVINSSLERNVETNMLHVVFQVKYNSKKLLCNPVEMISSLDGVKRVSMGWE
jgi:putative Mg2+ transporter-C (MgtC) family protein